MRCLAHDSANWIWHNLVISYGLIVKRDSFYGAPMQADLDHESGVNEFSLYTICEATPAVSAEEISKDGNEVLTTLSK